MLSHYQLDTMNSAASSAVAAQRIGGYLDNLARGSALSGGAGIQGYISSVGSNSAIQGSASAVKSYLDAMSSGATAAPSAPVIKSYLDDMSSGAASVPTSGAGIANYISSLPVTVSRVGGAGIGSYLDGIHQACDAHPTSECAQAITSYMDALSTGAAP